MPGVILIVIALLLGLITGAFRRVPNQGTVMGEIVSLQRERDLDGGRTRYAGSVEYYVDGKPYYVETASKSSTFRTGQRMRVAYDRTDPGRAVVRPKAAIYGIMMAFFMAGLVLCVRALLQ